MAKKEKSYQKREQEEIRFAYLLFKIYGSKTKNKLNAIEGKNPSIIPFNQLFSSATRTMNPNPFNLDNSFKLVKAEMKVTGMDQNKNSMAKSIYIIKSLWIQISKEKESE